jgi:hypothetical protein
MHDWALTVIALAILGHGFFGGGYDSRVATALFRIAEQLEKIAAALEKRR